MKSNCFLAKNLRSWKDGDATNWGEAAKGVVHGKSWKLEPKSSHFLPHTFERNKPKVFIHFETVVLVLRDPEV